MKKIFDYAGVIVNAVLLLLGSIAICNIFAMDAQEAYGKCAGIVTFFGSFVVFWAVFMRWLVLLGKQR